MNKAKAKEFWEKNKGKIIVVGGITVGVTLFAIGYKRGLKMAHVNELWIEAEDIPAAFSEFFHDSEQLDTIIKNANKAFNKGLSADSLVYGVGFSFGEL